MTTILLTSGCLITEYPSSSVQGVGHTVLIQSADNFSIILYVKACIIKESQALLLILLIPK